MSCAGVLPRSLGLLVAGMTQLTHSSERMNLRSVCVQVSTPDPRKGSTSLSDGALRMRWPLTNDEEEIELHLRPFPYVS